MKKITMSNIISHGPKKKNKKSAARRPGALPGVPRPFRKPENPTRWRAARLKLNITQQEMAKRLGLSVSRVRDFESGRGAPRRAYEFALHSITRSPF